jgi:release factor glutamine methyltransferase
VIGADLSEEAVELAGRNARYLGLEDRVSFRQGDLYAPFEEARFQGSVDVITCNPPYISSAKVRSLVGVGGVFARMAGWSVS